MKKTILSLLLAGGLLGAGCGDNREDFVITNNTNVTVAPVCQDDAYTTNQNTPLVVNAANGVLANDVRNGAILTFNATSTQNGTVAMNQDGSFTYTPATDFNGTDTFTYTLTNPGGSSICTVTIIVTAVNGFFVDAANGNDGTGSFTNGRPFQTIQGAVNAAGINDTIVVRPGSYTGAVNLKNGQRLVGSGSTLVNAQGAVRPVLSSPVVLADGNTIDFLRFSGVTGDAVDGNGQTGGTVINCEIVNTIGDAVGLEGCSGSWNVSENSISGTTGVGVFGVRLSINAGTAELRANRNEFRSNGGSIGITAESTGEIRVQVSGNDMSLNTGAGAAFEFFVGDDARACLDLEDNTNDDTYRLAGLSGGTATFEIEQRDALTLAQPAGAGNTGTVTIDSGVGFFAPQDVSDGTCFPN